MFDAVVYVPLLSRRPLSRTRLAGVVRWRGQQRATLPFHLVGELLPELVPALVENGTVQRGFLTHTLTRLPA